MNLYREMKDEANEATCPSTKQCTKLIHTLASTCTLTNIVIDGLDECDSQTRCKLLLALKGLMQQSGTIVKVFISSRDEWDIMSQLESMPNYFVRPSDSLEDIKAYVLWEVDQSILENRLLGGKISEDLRLYISDTLIDRANGM